MKIIDMVIDLVMLMDLILHFLYAYINKRQKMVKDFKSIFFKYILGTFFSDLFALFPYYISVSF